MGRRGQDDPYLSAADRGVKDWIRTERDEHVKAIEGIADGDTSKADARIAKLASSLPDLRALKTRLLLQPDLPLRQASFEMIYPHLSFPVTDADLVDIDCHLPVADDALTITEVEE